MNARNGKPEHENGEGVGKTRQTESLEEDGGLYLDALFVLPDRHRAHGIASQFRHIAKIVDRERPTICRLVQRLSSVCGH
ncbi:hypothetical protein [Bradyrhizobium sp. Cp5.3]|uniref:hypothetical protein n=1 Tax=Bradyrhizobium sp. Cp5.3 TaxID=443598 RepID=UPI00047F8574|nr:hypothetical protein [Bradyrhizobium sp. Cp5.3]